MHFINPCRTNILFFLWMVDFVEELDVFKHIFLGQKISVVASNCLGLNNPSVMQCYITGATHSSLSCKALLTLAVFTCVQKCNSSAIAAFRFVTSRPLSPSDFVVHLGGEISSLAMLGHMLCSKKPHHFCFLKWKTIFYRSPINFYLRWKIWPPCTWRSLTPKWTCLLSSMQHVYFDLFPFSKNFILFFFQKLLCVLFYFVSQIIVEQDFNIMLICSTPIAMSSLK